MRPHSLIINVLKLFYMKLHLPKILLTAVFATMATTAWADWGTDTLANTYYVDAAMIQAVNATDKGTTITISPTGEVTESTISSVSLKNGSTLNISGNDGSNFDALTITDLSIANNGNNTGSATMNVNGNQNVVLNGLSQGALNVKVGESANSVYTAAALTLNDGVSISQLSGVKGTTTVYGDVSIDKIDLGNGGNNDGSVLVKTGANLTAAQYWNHMNSEGSVSVEKDATFTVNGLKLTGLSDTTTASIKRKTSGGSYSLAATEFTISNGQIQVSNGGTINNVLSNVDVLHDSDNTLTISNANNDLGTVKVNKGTVNLASLKTDGEITATIAEGAQLGISGSIGALNASGSGTIVVNTGAELSGESSISSDMLFHTTLKNNGTFTFSGKAIAHLIDVLEHEGDIGYSDGQNGYVSGKFYLVKSEGEGASAIATNVTLNGYAVQGSGTANLYIEADGTKGSYYVTTGTADYNAEAATTAIVMNGGTLNLNAALADGVGIWTKTTTNSVINVAAGVTLANDSVDAANGKSTLKGDENAVYNMGLAKLNGEGDFAKSQTKLNVLVGENWQGTVVFAQGSVIKEHGFDLNNYGVVGSTIQFNGVASGSYLGQGSDSAATYVADIELNGDGFAIEDGFGGGTHTFTGAFKGEGAFNMNKAGLKGGLKFVFAGDMSQWQGELKQSAAANNDYSYTFSDEATNIANKVTAKAGTMVVKVDNDDVVTITGDVTADGGVLNLTKTGDSKLTVNNMVAKSSNIVLTGSADNAIDIGNLSIAAGKNVTGAADITVTKNMTLNAAESVALTGNLVFGEGASLTLGDSLVSTIVAGEQSSFTLATAQNITVSDTFALTNQLDLTNTAYNRYELAVQDIVQSAARSGDTVTGQKLVLTLISDAPALTEITVSDVVGYADGTLTLKTDLSANDTLTSETLDVLIGTDAWKDALAMDLGELIKVQLQDALGNAIDLSGLQAVTLNGVTAIAPIVGPTAGGVAGSYITAYIPEPTSTTLSMLALAALAVRRRRR